MITSITARIDEIANELQAAGMPHVALALDRVCDRLEGREASFKEKIKNLMDFFSDKDWSLTTRECMKIVKQLFKTDPARLKKIVDKLSKVNKDGLKNGPRTTGPLNAWDIIKGMDPKTVWAVLDVASAVGAFDLSKMQQFAMIEN